jgi:hypothetical protein
VWHGGKDLPPCRSAAGSWHRATPPCRHNQAPTAVPHGVRSLRFMNLGHPTDLLEPSAAKVTWPDLYAWDNDDGARSLPFTKAWKTALMTTLLDSSKAHMQRLRNSPFSPESPRGMLATAHLRPPARMAVSWTTCLPMGKCLVPE